MCTRNLWSAARAGVVSLALLTMCPRAHAVVEVNTQSSILLPGEFQNWQMFGQSVAVDGSTVIVGAPRNQNEHGSEAGAAWVYVRGAGGTWTLQARLLPSDGTPGALFGWDVAVRGNVAVVSSPQQTNSFGYDGAAYVYTRDGSGHWTETAKLTSSDAGPYQWFGRSVALDDNTLAVGADDFSYTDYPGMRGAVYVFVRDTSGNWTQQAKLTASDGKNLDRLGYVVGIDGDTIVAGADHGDGNAADSGAAYLFVRDSGGTWREQAKLTASDGDFDDMFGVGVAVDGNTAVIGAYGHGVNLTGGAYVFERDAGGSWHLAQELMSPGYNSRFGESVAIQGNRLVVAAPYQSYVGESDSFASGTVTAYDRDANGVWHKTAVLMVPRVDDTQSMELGGGWTGQGVAMSGGIVLAGGVGFGSSTGRFGGAAVFEDDNQPPLVSGLLVNPSPVATAQPFRVTATLDDHATGNSAISSAYYTVDGGGLIPMAAVDGAFDQATEAVAASHAGLSAGVYTICVGGMDAMPNAALEECTFLPVYDPSAGFVTGGGWILSPAGAMPSAPALTGRANFGFVSRYQKGATVPTGNTEFQFQVGRINFSSSSYQWLVVAGGKAMYKGTGTINGTGNYGFMLSAIDGDLKGGPDRFRIKIWDRDNGDAVVYDNNVGAADGADPATAVSSGSIVIHST